MPWNAAFGWSSTLVSLDRWTYDLANLMRCIHALAHMWSYELFEQRDTGRNEPSYRVLAVFIDTNPVINH
jgi:hypothetical protein